MHDATPPLRFRTPPGWPTPSSEWVDLFQGAEPDAGWRPSDDTPPAPSRWRFWAPTRALHRRVPRAARVVPVVGAAIALASFVAVVVLWAVGGPAVLALAPVVAGTALWVVGASRYADRLTEALHAVRAEASLRRATELPARAAAVFPGADPADASAGWDARGWAVPGARPFVAGPPSQSGTRPQRALVAVTAGVAGLVLATGASVSLLPLVPAVEEGAARALTGVQPGSPWSVEGDDEDAAQPEWTSDDGSIEAWWLAGDDEWEGTCDLTPGDAGCDAYEIDSDRTCTAVVTVGFFASLDDARPSRVEERTVSMTEGVPLVLVENHDEDTSSIGDVSCASDDDPHADRIAASQGADADTDAERPAGCATTDCVAFAVRSSTDCADAAVQFRVGAEVGSIGAPHDVVVMTPLLAGQPTDVFVGGTTYASDVTPGGVTCRAGTEDGSATHA